MSQRFWWQVHYVVGGEGTADTMMWQNLQKKLGMAGRVLDGHGTGSAAGVPYCY